MGRVQKIYLVTHGLKSSCEFVPADQVALFLKQLGDEGRCALVTATDLTTDDVECWENSREIIQRLENDVTETKLNLASRLLTKRGA